MGDRNSLIVDVTEIESDMAMHATGSWNVQDGGGLHLGIASVLSTGGDEVYDAIATTDNAKGESIAVSVKEQEHNVNEQAFAT